VTTIGSTALLFTPFFLFGIGGLVASGAGGIATTVGDEIANSVKGKSLHNLAEEAKKISEKLDYYGKKFSNSCEAIAARLEVDPGVMSSMIIGTCKTISEGMIKDLPQLIELGQLPNITAFVTALKSGATATQAAKLAATTTSVAATGQRASVGLTAGLASSVEGINFANTGGQAVLTGVKAGGQVVSKFAVAMAGLGCVISLGDCILSWVNGNPKRSECNSLIEKINKAMKDIITFRIKTNSDEYRVVSFKNKYSGKYLDVSNGKFELHNKLWQWGRNNTRAQKFYMEYLSENKGEWQVRIHCCGKEKFSVGSDNGNICVVPKNAESGKFTLVENSDGTVFIQRDGKVFDVQGCSSYDKAYVLFYQKNNQSNQKWDVIDI